jgi:hypothetical protein
MICKKKFVKEGIYRQRIELLKLCITAAQKCHPWPKMDAKGGHFQYNF